ncbi:response regulator [Neiella sp. HB171785]|uniref:histidine kinase n=1 Tax=Neiella litorisoli TaxID=2771431 RepID=A0A8J6UM88_9GAMM|nr:ATP-binding protein [Neiella litorisoli]MBD1390225.1 response regulator [Neiella litorisoli]
MAREWFSPETWQNKSLFVAIGLGVLGAVTNLFTIPMFANTSLVLGGVFSMLAAILMRPHHALLASVIATTGLLINWQHGWGYIWFPLEVLFVNWMVRQRIHALIADLLYWLLVGMPLVYLVLISVEQLSPPMLATILVKQALNGYLYTLLAAFIAMLPWCRTFLSDRPLSLPPLKIYLTQAFGMLATLSLLAYGLVSERHYTDDVKQQLELDLSNYSGQIRTYGLQQKAIERNQMDALVAIWRTNLGPGVMPSQVQLDAMFEANPRYLALMLVSPDGQLLRYSQQSDFQQSLRSRSPAPQIKQDELQRAGKSRLTRLSHSVANSDFGFQPTVIATRPIYGTDNFTIKGYVQGILPLKQHQKNLDSFLAGTPFEFVILDSNQQVNLSSSNLGLPLNSHFVFDTQSMSALPLPLPALTTELGNRKADYFYHRRPLDQQTEVMVLTPATKVLVKLQQHYLKWALFIVIASLASVVLGQLLAGLFTQPLDALLRFSSQDNFPIPKDKSQSHNFHYREQHQLFANIVRKTKALASYHNSLEHQVSTRTQELQMLNDRLSRVLQASSDGILEVNGKGRINFANQMLAGWLEQPPEQLVGQSIEGLLLPVSGSMTLEQCVHEARFTGTMAEGEGQLRRDGVLIELEFNAAPTAVEDGNVGAVVMLRNATSRKEIQRNVEHARRSAELAAQAKSDFVANVSHEIRTPLNAIGGLIQLFGRDNLSLEQKQYLKRMAHGAELLQAIVNDILDFSKIEAGHLELNVQAFDLEALLDNLKLLMLPKAEQKQLQLNLELATDVPIGLVGDSLRLSQVLMNLVSNAIKFTKHGHVTVTVTVLPERDSDKAHLRMAVTDSGIGIAPEKLGNLFRPFTQADNATTRQYGGTGLGLAICQRLVGLMGGQLQVSSIPERGSKFWFDIQLPVAAPSAELLQTPSAIAESPNVAFNGQRILVVEDNSVNLQITQLMLTRLGLKADGAISAAIALEKLQQQAFDLVLMDLQMPEMDGIEAVGNIRQCRDWDNIPVVALTAHVSVADKKRCLAAGMQDHIGKPVVMTELTRVLARHLSFSVDGDDSHSGPHELATEAADLQYLQQTFYQRYGKIDVHLRTLVEIDAWQDARELINAASKSASDFKQTELNNLLATLARGIEQRQLDTTALAQLADYINTAQRQLQAAEINSVG